MDTFGDADPEDAWDAGDPRPEKLGLLVRVLLSVALESAHAGHDRTRALARLEWARESTATLAGHASDLERPVLEALALGFFYLTVAEG